MSSCSSSQIGRPNRARSCRSCSPPSGCCYGTYAGPAPITAGSCRLPIRIEKTVCSTVPSECDVVRRRLGPNGSQLGVQRSSPHERAPVEHQTLTQELPVVSSLLGVTEARTRCGLSMALPAMELAPTVPSALPSAYATAVNGRRGAAARAQSEGVGNGCDAFRKLARGRRGPSFYGRRAASILSCPSDIERRLTWPSSSTLKTAQAESSRNTGSRQVTRNVS
jgi:hypothetical protein